MGYDRVIFQIPASCQDLVTDINLETLENLFEFTSFHRILKKIDYLISRRVSGLTFKKPNYTLGNSQNRRYGIWAIRRENQKTDLNLNFADNQERPYSIELNTRRSGERRCRFQEDKTFVCRMWPDSNGLWRYSREESIPMRKIVARYPVWW